MREEYCNELKLDLNMCVFKNKFYFWKRWEKESGGSRDDCIKIKYVKLMKSKFWSYRDMFYRRDFVLYCYIYCLELNIYVCIIILFV